jgi:prepilin-type N-terminal cleavage/methylation domain-containing protein
MKNIIKKNKKGFSLVEVMISIGIMSILTYIVMSGQQTAIKTIGEFKAKTEVDQLIQTLTSNLSRVDICTQNFAGKTISQASIASIIDVAKPTPNKIITRMSPYGQEIIIDEISTELNAAKNFAGTGTGGTQMQLRVKYRPNLKGTAIENFVIPINVFTVDGTKNAASVIKNCFSDVRAMLEIAVRNACDTNNSVYTAGSGSTLGTCNSDFQVQNAASVAIAPSGSNYFCPAGQLLQKVAQGSTSPTWVYKCVTVPTGSCTAWQYIESFDPTTGNVVCKDIRNLTTWAAGTGIMVVQSGVYKLINVSCPAGWVLQSISAAGSGNCVDPKISYACPVNQYVISINHATGQPVCGNVVTPTGCAGGSFVTALNSDGSVNCKSASSGCGGGQYVSGINGAGDVVCATMP